MRNSLVLAFRYMSFYWGRSAILVVCMSITLFLPLAVHVLIGHYNRMMIERSDETPLVIGAKGSAYDLVLNTVYFKGRLQPRLSMQTVYEIRKGHRATPLPIYIRFTAAGQPIVGTTIEYFRFRRLKVRPGGTLPQMLGDVVLGAAVAKRLELSVGETIQSDEEKVYDISSSYPLLMRVVGILEETGTADDVVIFADVKTTWIIEGIGHGHANAQPLGDPTLLLGMSRDNVVMKAGAVAEHNEITPERIDSFHFHGDEADFPITAVIVLPNDDRARTILKTRYQHAEDVQAVVPREVIEKMMDIVFRVKRFFDVNYAMVLVSTVLFLVLVILLSLRIRRRELQTLRKIGCSRGTVFALQAAEIGILLTISLAVAIGLLAAVFWYVVRFDVLL